MHKTHIGDGPTPAEQRVEWANTPASAGQLRFVTKLVADIQHHLGDCTFGEAGAVIESLKTVRHSLTHQYTFPKVEPLPLMHRIDE